MYVMPILVYFSESVHHGLELSSERVQTETSIAYCRLHTEFWVTLILEFSYRRLNDFSLVLMTGLISRRLVIEAQ